MPRTTDRAQPGQSDIRAEVRAVFDAVRRRDPEDRPALLDEACAGKPELRAQVEALLGAWDDRSEAFVSGTAGARHLPDAREGKAALIGHYVVHDEIGRGGMGIVYLADDTLLSRRVALKAIHPELSQRPEQRERLRLEARAAAALSHPGVATVFALEEFDGVLYLASEFVPGRTLRQILHDGPLPDDTAADIGMQIARVLAVAHAQGVIHRDLKPENVIQTPSGIVKVLDFGLARQDGSAGQRLTQSGTVVGTPGYMAPEQILGEHLDFRADLFALGVLLYELVSGTNPFEGSTYGVTVDRILRNDPPPLVTSAHQPSALAPVVARCLAKDPKDRYASTPALVTDLELVHMASGVHATPGAGSKRASTSARNRRPPPTRWWWEFHQVSISVIYVLLMFPIWHVRSWLPRPWGGVVLFAALACAALATSLRLHLTFTARVYPGELATQRAWARPWTRGCDVGLAAMLLLAALAIGAAHQAWATLLVTMAIVTLVASLVIEPATTKAAFTRRSATMRARNNPP